MARPKRSSQALQKADKRQAGLRSINSTLDLGNGLTLATYSQAIEALRAKLSVYNTTISQLDDLSRDLAVMEGDLRNLSEQMLLGVGAKYGTASREYGKAGGVPKNERRRSVRKNTVQTGTEPKTASGSVL